MLNVYFRFYYTPELDYVDKPDDDFFALFTKDWLNDSFAKTVIKDIDKTEITSELLLYHPKWKYYPPQDLATGTKALLILHNTAYKVNGDRMGPNCVPYLEQIAAEKDITISLTYQMPLTTFPIRCVNDGSIINSYLEYIDKWFIYYYESLKQYT